MVTTNSEAEQIRQMFGGAVQRVTQLSAKIEGDEQDLLRDAYEFFRTAVDAVVPVLKYVDKQIRTDVGTYVRGIELSSALLLVRGGNLQWRHSRQTFALERLRFQGDPDEQMRQISHMLMVLGLAFSDALVKAEEHEQSIRQRRDQFEQAAQIFKS